MKKVLVILLALTLIFSFSGCGNNDTTPDTTTPDTTTPDTTTPDTTAPGGTTEPAGQYRDGTYEGKGDKWQYGDENATVVVQGAKITQVTLRRLDTEGKEVNYEEWTGAEVGGQVRPNLKQFREDMAKEIVQKQTTEGVNEIAGATVSSKNWKLAVERALEQAEVK